jgi:hypothetical protein
MCPRKAPVKPRKQPRKARKADTSESGHLSARTQSTEIKLLTIDYQHLKMNVPVRIYITS